LISRVNLASNVAQVCCLTIRPRSPLAPLNKATVYTQVKVN